MISHQVTVGPSAVSATRYGVFRMDEWALPSIAVQCKVSGTVNYSIQSSLDDPNDPVNPVASVSAMSWVNDSNAITASTLISYSFIPKYICLLLNSGSGTVTMTVMQAGPTP